MPSFADDLARLRASMQEGVLAPKADAILALARPCLRVARERAGDAAIPVGASKFGGAPDVPEGFVWPESNGRPLDFLAQFDLKAATVLDSPFPPDGVLAFFYDVEEQSWGDAKERDSWRVFWFPPEAPLVRRDPFGEPLPVCRLSFVEGASLPTFESSLYDDLGLDDEQDDAYSDLEEMLRTAPMHQFLGHSYPIQNDVPFNVEIAARGPVKGSWDGPAGKRRIAASQEWRLILQLDSDEEAAGWMWGDVGMLYFLVRDEDLRARRFDEAWMTLQCY